MHHILNARADTHKDFCEDSYYYSERDGWVICGVFDGCGEGIHSHFASQLHSYALRWVVDSYWTENLQLISQGKMGMRSIMDMTVASVAQIAIRAADTLKITELENLSTAVVLFYDTKNRHLLVKFLGDGVVRINHTMHRIDSGATNAPNYVGHLKLGDITSLHRVLSDTTRYPLIEATEVTSFSLCTDGIDAIRHSHRPLEEVHHYLLEDKFLYKSKAMLSRKINILRGEGLILNDDLTIIRYEAI